MLTHTEFLLLYSDVWGKCDVLGFVSFTSVMLIGNRGATITFSNTDQDWINVGGKTTYPKITMVQQYITFLCFASTKYKNFKVVKRIQNIESAQILKETTGFRKSKKAVL